MQCVKQAGLAVVLAGVVFCCSGCATILGGIIGHQSGELAAGLAIGAVVDFGETIVTSVGQMTANQAKEFRLRTVVDSDTGRIELPKKAFSVDRTKQLLGQMQPNFQEAGWTWQRTRMNSNFSVTDYHHSETWRCTDAAGQSFTVDINMGWKKDSTFQVCVPADSTADRSAVTLQLYAWLEDQIVNKGAKCG